LKHHRRPTVAITRCLTLPFSLRFSTICRYWYLPDFFTLANIGEPPLY
jgi:hypothetical protein